MARLQHHSVSRRYRARRLVRLERERLAVEAELEASGCRFRGPVEHDHRALSWQLDRIAHQEHQAWAA